MKERPTNRVDESLQLDKPASEENNAQTQQSKEVKKQEVKIPITAEAQFELEILQLEKQACEAEKIVAEAHLAKVKKTIEYKTQKILTAYKLQQEAVQRSKETGVVVSPELATPVK